MFFYESFDQIAFFLTGLATILLKLDIHEAMCHMTTNGPGHEPAGADAWCDYSHCGTNSRAE